MRTGPLCAAALVVVACGGEDPPRPAAASPVPAIEVSGCADVREGACLLSPEVRTVSLWVDAPADIRPTVRIDGRKAEAQPSGTRADGGVHLSVDVPDGTRELALVGQWTDDWSLPLRWLPALDAVAQANAASGEAKVEILDAAATAASGLDRVRLLDQLRVEVRRRGDVTRSRSLAQQQAELAAKLGYRRFEAAARMAEGFDALERGKLDAARGFLTAASAHANAFPIVAAEANHLAGLLHRKTGDITAAVTSLSEAERAARRHQLHRVLPSILLAKATTLGELGRGEEATRAAAGALEAADDLPCVDRGRLVSTVGWINLILDDQRLPHEPPTPFFERALAAFAPGGACPHPVLAADVLVNLALAALAEDEPELALDHVRSIEAVPPHLRAWATEVEARVGLATGRWSLVPSLLETPRAGSPGLRWAAWQRQARARERFGLIDAAIDADARSEALLDELVESLGIDHGRELFLAGRSASAEALVRMLTHQGRIDEALCRARLARGRALHRLDRAAKLSRADAAVRERWSAAVREYAETRDRLAREAAGDWELSDAAREAAVARRRDQQRASTRALDAAFRAVGARRQALTCADLPAPVPGELLLVFFPFEAGGVMFSVREGGAEAHRLPEARWREAVGEALAGLAMIPASVRVLSTGDTWDFPIHALEVRGRPLSELASVTYGLDLTGDPTAALSDRAVIVVDPSRNLPHAKAEAEAVREHLSASRLEIVELGGSAATRDKIIAALAEARLFHYAGHGRRGGRSGWDAALLLPEGDALSVTDILALPSVPPARRPRGLRNRARRAPYPRRRHEPRPRVPPRRRLGGSRGRPGGAGRARAAARRAHLRTRRARRSRRRIGVGRPGPPRAASGRRLVGLPGPHPVTITELRASARC